jgi:hypothetical protein
MRFFSITLLYKSGAKILLFLDKRTKETKKICSYVLMSNKIYTFACKILKSLQKHEFQQDIQTADRHEGVTAFHLLVIPRPAVSL